jgi:GTPase-associated adaptor domain
VPDRWGVAALARLLGAGRPIARRDMDPGRRLVYRFFGLSHTQRVTMVRALGLLVPEDETAPEMETFRRCFQRARETGGLAALWDQVEASHPDGDPGRNPFGAP